MEKTKKKLTEKQVIHVLMACVAVMLICIVVMFICTINLVKENETLQTEKTEMQMQYDLEKKELSEKVTLLSNQLTAWIEEEEAQAQKKVPTGLPVSGKVITIESEPIIIATEKEGTGQVADDDVEADTDTDEENPEIDENIVEQEIPTVVFGVKKETQIVAAGAGEVKTVEELAEGTSVKIDHGNGYMSVYLFKGTPKVKVGDEVLRGTLLFEVTSNNAKFSFQILENENYVNPMDLMEIHG
ncbi:MAG: M23 family metallopeptidase [Lachnospiraceae bacterium]|nr:M23 family metallopeptidase [Lachnospiraceae bacterium]